MLLHKNNDVPPSPLAARLRLCVERVGNKRALATAALVSEAQLFRYLNAETDLPSDKLLAIARAARVDAGWLLTGNGDMESGVVAVDKRPVFRGELLVQVVQTFEELLMESDKTFTPRQRALAVTLIYKALRFEEIQRGIEQDIDKKLAPYYPDILAPLRNDGRMQDYIAAMQTIEAGETLTLQSLRQFDALIKMTMQSAFEGSAGEIHFEHMGTTLLPEASRMLLQTVEECAALIGKESLNWLDAGCGNGRHLAFLASHCPHLNLKGFEASELALNLCDQMVKSGKIPAGTIDEADFRNLPYPTASMDVVYCRMGLYLMPYMPGSPVGAVEFMKEVARVLKPGGVASVITLAGTGRSYIYFAQYHTPESLQMLAAECGLKVLRTEEVPINETGGVSGKDYAPKFKGALKATFVKAE